MTILDRELGTGVARQAQGYALARACQLAEQPALFTKLVDQKDAAWLRLATTAVSEGEMTV